VTATKIRLHTPAWNWDQLEPGTAPWRAAWADLGEWVYWYTTHYELWQAMPVCWFRHSRLAEELRALRFLHEAVFEARPRFTPTGDKVVERPSPRAYSEWMIARREWERLVLGIDHRQHGACTGLRHCPTGSASSKGRTARLDAMAVGLAEMLDTMLPGERAEEH
jgi:hypothetical protein